LNPRTPGAMLARLVGAGCNGRVTHEVRHEILLLQDGGALEAYQAGVYEGLVEVGVLSENHIRMYW
jgi:hypothetical protein